MARLILVLLLSGCVYIKTTDRTGNTEERLGVGPIVITPSAGPGDIQTVQGVGAAVAAGQYGGHATVGWYYTRTVFADDCGLALDLETDRPDLIPEALWRPCSGE